MYGYFGNLITLAIILGTIQLMAMMATVILYVHIKCKGKTVTDVNEANTLTTKL